MNKNNPVSVYTNAQPVPSVYNEGFSQYETILFLINLINDLITNQNLGADEIAELFSKKVSMEYYLNDLANNRKLSSSGDFTGSWFGISRPELSEPGIAGVVIKHTNDIGDISQLSTIAKSNLVFAINENSNLLTNTQTLHPTGSNNTATWNNIMSIANLSNGLVLNLSSGDYYIDNGNLSSNMIINGRGTARILSETIMFSSNSGSADINNNIKNIVFNNIIFESITKTFSEYIHLFNINGVSNITFNNCKFIGFKGDGVYLGFGQTGEERHNENIFFDKCIFDGVSNTNRNAISIIDGTNVNINNCIFKNCTAPNMPGAIDLEPNAYNSTIIKNITITKNIFDKVGGMNGVIGCYFLKPQSYFNKPIQNITIEGNKILSTIGSQTGIQIRQINTSKIDVNTPNMNVMIKNNFINNCGNFGGFFTGINGIEIYNNVFDNNSNGVLIGSADANVNNVINANIEKNKFGKTIGSINGGLLLYTIDNIKLNKNQFIDCKGSGIVFTTGTTKDISIMDNNFNSSGLMPVAIEKKSDHTFTQSTNIDKNNFYNGLINQFIADKKEYYTLNSYDTSKLPESFMLGEEISMIDGDTNLPSVSKQGILKTIRPIMNGGGYNKYTVQWFYPANNDSTTLSDMYFRKGLTSNAWSGWKKISGV